MSRPPAGGPGSHFRVHFSQLKFSSVGTGLTSPAEGGSSRSSPSSRLVRQVLSTHLRRPARPSYRRRVRLVAQESKLVGSD